MKTYLNEKLLSTKYGIHSPVLLMQMHIKKEIVIGYFLAGWWGTTLAKRANFNFPLGS
jgi:hypothetical protein